MSIHADMHVHGDFSAKAKEYTYMEYKDRYLVLQLKCEEGKIDFYITEEQLDMIRNVKIERLEPPKKEEVSS